MSTDSQDENSVKPLENDSPINTPLNSNSDENSGLLKPSKTRRTYSSRTANEKSLGTKSTTFAPFESSESSVGTIATRRGTSKGRKSRKSSRKSRSSISRRRSSRRSTSRRSTTANLRRKTSRAKSIITKASGTNVDGEDGKPSLSMNDKGAIRLMLPGKIQHKTTIKLSHYPEQGNDSIEVNIPTTIASPAAPEIQSPINNIPMQSSYQMPIQQTQQIVYEPANNENNQQCGGDLADAAQAFNALMSPGVSDQSDVVSNLQQQLQYCQQQQQYQQQQYLQYQQAMTQAYMTAYQNPYCCYPYDSSYYQQYQYGGYPPY